MKQFKLALAAVLGSMLGIGLGLLMGMTPMEHKKHEWQHPHSCNKMQVDNMQTYYNNCLQSAYFSNVCLDKAEHMFCDCHQGEK